MGDVAGLMEAWDEMENAAQRVLTALPSQMTEAAARLDASRVKMRAALQDYATKELRRS